MKNKNIASTLGVIGISSLVGLSSISAQDAAPTPPKAPVAPAAPEISEAEKKQIRSYIIGYQHGQSLFGYGLIADDVDNDAVMKGFLEGLKGDKPSYEEEKIRVVMQAFVETMQERQAKKAAANLAAGQAFLAENGKREGVITTASGLQYEVLKKGTDKKYVAPAGGPDMKTKFLVHYRGTLIDGTEFDKSPEGQPIPMTLQVIPGFKEAITTMPIGAKWKLFIPTNLAYGPNPPSPQIAPNSALIFDLELVEIQVAPPAPKQPAASAVTPPVPIPAPPKAESKKASAE